MIVIHTDTGLDIVQPRAYYNVVDRQFRLPFFANAYALGMLEPRYPVPAIDYYHSTHKDHVPIGNAMEWSHSDAEIEQVLSYCANY